MRTIVQTILAARFNVMASPAAARLADILQTASTQGMAIFWEGHGARFTTSFTFCPKDACGQRFEASGDELYVTIAGGKLATVLRGAELDACETALAVALRDHVSALSRTIARRSTMRPAAM